VNREKTHARNPEIGGEGAWEVLRIGGKIVHGSHDKGGGRGMRPVKGSGAGETFSLRGELKNRTLEKG